MSDYTFLVAYGLAGAGDAVHVWCPPADRKTPEIRGVEVHKELGNISPGDLRRVGRLLDRFNSPRRLLVQWVPHGYGYRSMNLPFCLWLWRRAKFNHDTIELMVHEPFLAFREGTLKQDAAAAVHRVMTALLLGAASRVWVSIPAWESHLRPYALGRQMPFGWLPIPSTVPAIADPSGVAAIRARYAPAQGFLVGHLGTYARHIAGPLMSVLRRILQGHSNVSALLMGRGGESSRDEFTRKHEEFSGRVHATGVLEAADLSRHLSACDLMIQPYPDGVSSRRTSATAGLSHSLPIATTTGRLTEPLWEQSAAVALAPAGDADALANEVERLLADDSERHRLSKAARKLYQERFDIKHTIAALRDGAGRSD